jgi:hypothetical protein
MFIEQFYSFISLKEHQLSQEQKFSLYICFTLMVYLIVTYTKILDDFLEGGKKNNKQKGGGNLAIIGLILGLLIVCIFIIDDGETKHQKLFASNLETILKNNQVEIVEMQAAASNFWFSSSPTPTPTPKKESVFIQLKSNDDDNHLNFMFGDFIPRTSVDEPSEYFIANNVLGRMLKIIPEYFLANNELGRMLKGTVDLSQLKLIIKEIVQSCNKMLGDNVISFNNNEQLIVNENFFKMFSSTFIEENIDYIKENIDLSCEEKIENCGNLYNKMTSPLFLKRRILSMNEKNTIQFTKENVQREINNAIDEWSFYYKQANLKDFLLKMNKFENKLEKNIISYDDYKERISRELNEHIKRVVNIETDIILIKNDLQDPKGNINTMIDTMIIRANKNMLELAVIDFVVGPLGEAAREFAYQSVNIASSTVFAGLNGALHAARFDKRALSSLFLLLSVLGVVTFGVSHMIYILSAAASKGLVAGQKDLIKEKTEQIKAQSKADRERIEAQSKADLEQIKAQSRADRERIEATQRARIEGFRAENANEQPQINERNELIENANGQPQIDGGGKKSRKHKVTKKSVEIRKKSKKQKNHKRRK